MSNSGQYLSNQLSDIIRFKALNQEKSVVIIYFFNLSPTNSGIN